jgi:hypothetical protein
MEGLTVGRMVHFVSGWGGEHMAAIVTRVENADKGRVQVMVLNPFDRSQRFYDDVLHDHEGHMIGTWHWIERA